MSDTEDLLDWKLRNKNYVPNVLKYSLVFLSYLFWISGAIFAALGGWTISQSVRYGPLSHVATGPGAVAAASGCFIFILSGFGVLGTLRENLFYLRTFKTILIVMLVFELCVGLVGFSYWPEVKKVADEKIRQGIIQYEDDEGYHFMMNQIQRQFECCGSLTVDDWDSSRYYRCKFVGSYRSCGVPWSCCHVEFQRNRQCGLKARKRRVGMSKRIFTIGCLDKLFEFVSEKMPLMGGLAIACNLPVILGIILTGKLIEQIKKINRVFKEENEKYEEVEENNREQEPSSETDETHLI